MSFPNWSTTIKAAGLDHSYEMSQTATQSFYSLIFKDSVYPSSNFFNFPFANQLRLNDSRKDATIVAPVMTAGGSKSTTDLASSCAIAPRAAST